MSKKKQKKAAQQSRENGFNRASQEVHGALVRTSSHIRLSLTFRIAMHYCWQLVRTAIPVCLLVTLALTIALTPGIRDRLVHAAAVIPAEDGAFTQQQVGDPALVLTPLAETIPQQTGDLIGFYAVHLGRSPQPGLWLNLPVASAAVPEGSLLVSISLREPALIWLAMMAAVLFCDLWRMVYFARHAHRLDKRVLAPIREIAEMAGTLSGSNLSNRINVAGTKNELRDLAIVINTMLDRIERSYNSQKQFVSDASHELRTPIAVIQGYVSMLDRWGKEDPEVLSEGLTAIRQETASMKDLVENLLFLARHDKKTLMLEMSEFDPADVLSELHREAEMVTPEDTFHLASCDHTMMTADRNMIKQVMRILLDNAVKYTPKGGEISMGVRTDAEGCTLFMRDNGPGIPAEELPKIFDRFYRSDKARKAESGGHGLGLSIARIIVIAHGGKLRVRSKVGEGTTFYVMLPKTQKTA